MNVFIITILILFALVVLFFAGALFDIYRGMKVKHPKLPESRFITGANRLTYFANGRELYNDMKQSIEEARHHIHLCFFIFNVDDVGIEWLDLLKKKAEEGVKVRLLVDSLTGLSLKRELPSLKQTGIQVVFSGKIRFPYTFYYISRRNHRKIAVIDGKIGYFGGFNVSREYIGNKPEMGAWHDNHLKVEGESCRDLQKQFFKDWKRAGGSPIESVDASHDEAYFPRLPKGPSSLTLLATNGKQVEDVFAEKLGGAQSSIIIGSPYFIPTRRLMDVLIDRLNHGVELKILLPMKRDHPFVKPASFLYLETLVEKGAELYHFYQGFYHAKLFVVDQRLCYLGTANFDQRSFYWDDELLGLTDDRDVIHQVLDQLNREIREQSKPVTLQDIRNRSFGEKLKSACSGWFSFFL
ncbi:phosphatidylserine/phosphatidylglycerophosphate/cardiolipin synthase family protein [Sporolactobacillus sp. THM7-7]|nr:phosphatidylserine/phosphatidylglycerophosphate/cardiolipin synthase family protein [Sporolactobacillus sp. THM7-7]